MGRFGLFLVCALCPRCLCDEELRKAVGAAQLPVTPIAVAVLLHTTPTTKQLLLDSFHWLTRLHNTTVIFVDDATNRTELKPVNGTAHVFEFTVDAAEVMAPRRGILASAQGASLCEALRAACVPVCSAEVRPSSALASACKRF